MKKLEPYLGRTEHDGTVQVGYLRGPALADWLRTEGPRLGHILIRVRDGVCPAEGEPSTLDIVYQHPMAKSHAGPYPDTTQPMIPSGGSHVGFANFVRELAKDGLHRIELDWKPIGTSGRQECIKWIDIDRDEVMSMPYDDACYLLNQWQPIFEEVDPDPTVVAEPEPEDKPEPAFAKKKRRKPKEQ